MKSDQPCLVMPEFTIVMEENEVESDRFENKSPIAVSKSDQGPKH